MNEELKKSIVDHFEARLNAIGFAPVDRFEDAPQKHHPSRVCKDARTVIVFGKTVPRGILRSPDYNLYALHRSYHTVYKYLDELSLELCNYIEARGKYLDTIKHAIYPLALKDEIGRKQIERVINTAGYNYWLACDECLKVCPLNKKQFHNPV